MLRFPIIAVALLLAAMGSAKAATDTSSIGEAPRIDGPPPANRVFVQSISAVRLNPLGLLEIATLSYRSRIVKSESPVLMENFGGLGLTADLSPAFARVGPMIELQPLTIFRIWAAYQVVGYFGTFNLLQSFSSPNAEHSDQTIKDLGDLEGRGGYATTGTQLTFGANFQIKLGPIAARAALRLVRADYDLRDGDRVFYDQFYDILVPDAGWCITDDADLLYVTDFGLAAGARWTATHAFHRPSHFAAGEADLSLNPVTHRVGPFIAYTFEKLAPGARFNTPTVILIANWWIEHRYRAGQEISQALPYLALGFMFTGDLWLGP